MRRLERHVGVVPGLRIKIRTGVCRQKDDSEAHEEGPNMSTLAAVGMLTLITVAVTTSSECAVDIFSTVFGISLAFKVAVTVRLWASMTRSGLLNVTDSQPSALF